MTQLKKTGSSLSYSTSSTLELVQHSNLSLFDTLGSGSGHTRSGSRPQMTEDTRSEPIRNRVHFNLENTEYEMERHNNFGSFNNREVERCNNSGSFNDRVRFNKPRPSQNRVHFDLPE